MNNTSCQIIDLGLIDYQEAYALQKSHVESILAGGEQTIFLCEHPSVLTMGRMSHKYNILVSKEELERKNVRVEYIDRGGDITLHSPGQLVVYPILNLANQEKDLHKYLHKLEQVGIELLSDFDIVANRFSGRTGVWVGSKKIASIGVGVRKWISYHGIGININTPLELFSLIRPCGLDVQMTSLAQLKGHNIDMAEVKKHVVQKCSTVFGLNFHITSIK